MSTLEVNTINPQSGNDVTLGGSSKNVKFASGTTVDFNTNTPTLTLGTAMKATPAFEAAQSATQSGVGDAVWTKMTMNTETFDTDGNYDNSSNYRFTPTTAGKYFVYVMGAGLSDTTYKLNVYNIAIYKNGSAYRQTNTTVNGADILNEHNAVCTAVIDMNGSSDYVEAYSRVNVTTGTGSIDARSSSGGFGAYRIVGV